MLTEEMKLNTKQWVVIACGALLFSLSELFPPWQYEDGYTSATRSAGYHFHEPAVKSPPEMKALFDVPDKDPPHSFSVREDVFRIYSQRIALPFLLLGLLLTLHNGRPRPAFIAGVFSLFIGVSFAVLSFLLILH